MSEVSNNDVLDLVTNREFPGAVESVRRYAESMSHALQNAQDHYVEGETQRSVQQEVATDFARFIDKARTLAADKRSGVTVERDESGNEKIQFATYNEYLWISKSVNAKTGRVSYNVTDVRGREKFRPFGTRPIASQAHINDESALHRARKVLDVKPVASHTD